MSVPPPPPDDADHTRTAPAPPWPPADTAGGRADGTIGASPEQERHAASISAHPPAIAVAGYVVEGELGRGGMGVVYKARDTRLNRPVALKVVLGDPDARSIIRFLAEAETVAAIHDAHVVQVYEFGESEGRPFLALEYLPGGTLADRIKAGRLPPEAAAALLEKVARGVAAAHAEGIVHRDLKPHNVLFDPHGEPKVTDFGLAKRGPGADLTQTGAVMGTPAYMSPEQAGGKTKFVGPQADVWALGIILYELVTGRRPFAADTADELLARVLLADPDPLRTVVPGSPQDLELICRNCLEKDPKDRYPSARELADDLAHYAAGEPISVRPPSLAALVRLWARQNFGAAGWAVAGGVAVGLLSGGYSLLELAGSKLPKVGAVYDRLPSEPRPPLAGRPVPDALLAASEAAMYLLLPALLLVVTALVRPRNRAADYVAGMLCGSLAAVTFFVVAWGWWSVYSTAVLRTLPDMALLAAPEADQLARYPDLAGLTREERREVLTAKAHYDLAARLPRGVIAGMVLAVGLTLPLNVALVRAAGTMIRRHGRWRVVVPLYFELALPCLVACGYVFLLAQRALLYAMPPRHPLAYLGLIALCVLAITAAARRWPWPVRVALTAGWFGYYLATSGLRLYEF